MTRDEFMEEARKEIDQVLLTHKNRLMNLVMKAWSEGKKNAEYDRVDEFGKDLLESLKKKLELDKLNNITIPTLDIPLVKGPYKGESITWAGDIPKACRSCPNHPSNGGNGICHCIIGTQPIMCNSTATDICDAITNDKMTVSDTVASATGMLREKEIYNTCCDNHIKIIHDMMTGATSIPDKAGSDR